MTEPTTLYQTFHGQSREDEIAWQLFQHDPSGYFVDVGAHDGLYYSNTYAFERRGWRGMCFEPHPEFHKQLVANRPGSTCIHAAVGNRIELATPFYSTPNAIFSSTSQADLESLRKIYVDEQEQFEKMQQISVPLITLDYALAIHGVERVDYLSVDVEGREMDVLQGFDIARRRPRLVIVENNNLWDALIEYFTAAGYTLARVVYQNMFFVRDVGDVEILKNYVVGSNDFGKYQEKSIEPEVLIPFPAK